MTYKLLYFEDFIKQEEYVFKNIDKISDIWKNSFISNSNKYLSDNNTVNHDNDYYMEQKNIILNSLNWSKWFFALEISTNKIIGQCNICTDKLSEYNGKNKIKTYEIIKSNDLSYDIYLNRNSVLLYPVISGLSKDPKFKNVGKFLINKIILYLKSNTSYKKLYLVPESPKYKNNYMDILDKNACLYDKEKYHESNIKLINYYKLNGFVIDKKIFLVLNCNKTNKYPDTSNILCLNTMYKKIIR